MNYKMTKKLKTAAEEAIRLRDFEIWPTGQTERGSAKRWYPSVMLKCCQDIRSPSRSWPNSLLHHCRSAKHVAIEHQIEQGRLSWAIRKIDKIAFFEVDA